MMENEQLRKALLLAGLGLLGAMDNVSGQNSDLVGDTRIREMERRKLNYVVPQTFNYHGIPTSKKYDLDTSFISVVVPGGFADEVVITVREQIRRERQMTDDEIVQKQKRTIEAIKRKR